MSSSFCVFLWVICAMSSHADTLRATGAEDRALESNSPRDSRRDSSRTTSRGAAAPCFFRLEARTHRTDRSPIPRKLTGNSALCGAFKNRFVNPFNVAVETCMGVRACIKRTDGLPVLPNRLACGSSVETGAPGLPTVTPDGKQVDPFLRPYRAFSRTLAHVATPPDQLT
jgi:hypothetical protein